MDDRDVGLQGESRAENCGHDHADHGQPNAGRTKASRRDFIKGVVASGVAVSASGYVLVGKPGQAQAQAAGAVERLMTINVNGVDRRVDVLPQETLQQTRCATSLV
ncbi:MAG: twin-arginine translocation signal domain-containing protein [Bauldia sp.]